MKIHKSLPINEGPKTGRHGHDENSSSVQTQNSLTVGEDRREISLRHRYQKIEVNCIFVSELGSWSSSPQMGGKMSSRQQEAALLVTAGGGVKGFSGMAGGSMIQ